MTQPAEHVPTLPAPEDAAPTRGGWLRPSEALVEGASLWAFYACLYVLSGALKPTPYIAHVYLAQAMLGGHFDIPSLPGWVEQTHVDGHHYLPYGIAPSLLMMPFVAIWGLDFRQGIFSACLGALAVVAWWSTLGHLRLAPAWRQALTAAYGMGSLFWFHAGQNGATWALMHVVANLGLMLALRGVVGRQHAWLAGFGFGLAVLSRQSIFLALPFFVGMLWRDDRATGGASIWRKALGFGLPLGLLMGFNGFYNWARFGNWLDNGYARTIHGMDDLPLGLFNVAYAAKHLEMYLVGVPLRLDTFPWFDPTLGGFSIFISTPALAFFLFANWRERINWLALGAIVPILAFYVVYYWSGYSQFGCRYSLDFLPFAMLLVASAFRDRWYNALSTVVTLGAVVQVWGLFWWGIKGL
ncbi:MAG: hypothetical protein VKS61_03715 [Candidatus Sericytochromatia bacterium]|nr:hypothetical protein [Candidatus Sericytochromatia bacterium]